MENKFKYYGISWEHDAAKRGNFSIGSIPNRQQVALYTDDGNKIKILAYFKSEEDANAFIDLLVSLTGVKR